MPATLSVITVKTVPFETMDLLRKCIVTAQIWLIKLTLVAVAEGTRDNSKKECNEEKSVSKTHVCGNI